MPQPTRVHDAPTDFIQRLDEVARAGNPAAICDGVTQALIDLVRRGGEGIPADLLEPDAERYARRLLYRCPEGTYSAMVMVWGPGQGTPIHDHGGRWCVECVLRGEIEVTHYEPLGDPQTDLIARFREAGRARGRVGDVGAYVPPNEYHRIANPTSATAATIHVYAGEMLWCHAFHPRPGGGYRREHCELEYTRR